MIIKSKYRKNLLTLAGIYRILPANKNNIQILIKSFPFLENEKKFESAYRHLREAKLLKKISLFDNEGNTKDAIEIAQKGINTLKENGIDIKNYQKTIYEKNTNLSTKQLLYKTAQADIFFKSALNRNNKLQYSSRDQLIDYSKKKNTWENVKQFRGARLNGLFYNGCKLIPIYNVKNKNIKINPNTETGFINGILGALVKSLNVNERIILADNIDIIDKTILMKDFKFDKSDKKQESIYKEATILNKDKLFLLINKYEQLNILDYFYFKEFNFLVKVYAQVRLGIGIDEEQDKYYYYHGALAIYETDTEVGFCIIQQELHALKRLYNTLCSNSKKLNPDAKKFVMYGLSCNKEIYDKLFANFSNVEFREINNADLWELLIAIE